MTDEGTAPQLPAYRITSETPASGEPLHFIEVAGRRHCIGSRYDPEKEAEKFAARVRPGAGDVLVLIGGGARLVREFLKKDFPYQLIYFEPLKELCGAVKAADPRLTIFETAETLFTHIRAFNVDGAKRFRVVLYPPLERPLGPYGEWIIGAVRRQFEERVAEIQTVTDIGYLVAKNLLENLNSFRKVSTLRHFLSLCPPQNAACVMGSGPSLDQSAPALASVQDHLRVISAASAIQPLLDRGIRPDIGVVLDPRAEEADPIEAIEMSARHSILWVVAATVHPTLMRLLPPTQTFVFTGDHPLEQWLSARLGDPATLAGGGSVILPAFDLASRLGAREIFLAGADFAVGERFETHVQGTARMKKILSTSSRFDTFESGIFRHTRETAPRLVESGGRTYRTGENLLAYRREMEQQISEYSGRCLQIHPVLPLAGADVCEDLDDLRRRPPIVKGSEFINGLSSHPGWAADQVLRGVCDELAARLGGRIETDPLFQLSVESIVFQKSRALGVRASTVMREESDRAAAELRSLIGKFREDR